MTKSTGISPPLLKRLDELTRPKHILLRETDEIYFLGEYTIGACHQHSKTNSLILNYKKPTEKKALPEWKYKEQAVNEVADFFRFTISNTIDLSDRVRHATSYPK